MTEEQKIDLKTRSCWDVDALLAEVEQLINELCTDMTRQRCGGGCRRYVRLRDMGEVDGQLWCAGCLAKRLAESEKRNG